MKKIIIKGVDIARVSLWKEFGKPKDEDEIVLYQLEENESFPLATEVDVKTAGKTLTASMDNVLAWRLGEIVLETMKSKDVGDFIDRGLILRRLLEEKNFYLISTDSRFSD